MTLKTGHVAARIFNRTTLYDEDRRRDREKRKVKRRSLLTRRSVDRGNSTRDPCRRGRRRLRPACRVPFTSFVIDVDCRRCGVLANSSLGAGFTFSDHTRHAPSDVRRLTDRRETHGLTRTRTNARTAKPSTEGTTPNAPIGQLLLAARPRHSSASARREKGGRLRVASCACAPPHGVARKLQRTG